MKVSENMWKVGVKIVKFDALYGAIPVTKVFAVGDKIGWWEEEVEEKEVDKFGRETVKKVKKLLSKHKMNIGRDEVEIDFDTKCTLESIQDITLKVSRTKCKTTVTATGGVKCEGQTPEVIEFKDVKEIVYKSEDGSLVSVKLRGGAEVSDPEDLPGAQDELCEKHGGKPREVDPKEQERIKAEQEARSALATAQASERSYWEQAKRAEDLEKKGKKDEAQKAKQEADQLKPKVIEKYKEFLEKFKDTKYYKQEKDNVEKALKKLGG